MKSGPRDGEHDSPPNKVTFVQVIALEAVIVLALSVAGLVWLMRTG